MLEKAGVRVRRSTFDHETIYVVLEGISEGTLFLQVNGMQSTSDERSSDTDFVVAAINEALRKRAIMDQIKDGQPRTIDVPPTEADAVRAQCSENLRAAEFWERQYTEILELMSETVDEAKKNSEISEHFFFISAKILLDIYP